MSSALPSEVIDTAAEVGAEPTNRAAVITGGPKAFAAGADIKEFAPKTFVGPSSYITHDAPGL